MAVTTNQRTVTYAGDGGTTAFSIPFPFFNQTDIVVTKTVGGVVSLLLLGADFTISGSAVNCTVAPAMGATLTI